MCQRTPSGTYSHWYSKSVHASLPIHIFIWIREHLLWHVPVDTWRAFTHRGEILLLFASEKTHSVTWSPWFTCVKRTYQVNYVESVFSDTWAAVLVLLIQHDPCHGNCFLWHMTYVIEHVFSDTFYTCVKENMFYDIEHDRKNPPPLGGLGLFRSNCVRENMFCDIGHVSEKTCSMT